MGVVLGTSLLFMCVTFKVHPYVFVIMYAAGCGVLKGFYKQCSLIAGWSHLSGKKGLVSGIILGGYGVGGSIYGIYYHKYIDPLNVDPVEDPHDHELYFPKQIGARYPEVQKWVCLYIFIISLIAILMISNYK